MLCIILNFSYFFMFYVCILNVSTKIFVKYPLKNFWEIMNKYGSEASNHLMFKKFIKSTVFYNPKVFNLRITDTITYNQFHNPF